MTYADPEQIGGPGPIQLSGWNRWWVERVWALEHAFERSRAAGRPSDDTRLRIAFLLGLFGLVFVALSTGATYAAVFSEAARAAGLTAATLESAAAPVDDEAEHSVETLDQLRPLLSLARD